MRSSEVVSESALSGLRVLDLTTLLAAPQIAALLGDFGADVLKLEPPGGDPLRQLGVQRGGASPAWAWVARNKRTLRLDLDRDSGQQLFRRLVARADVLVENLTSGLRERWQCGYETLSAWNPRLVVVSVSCFGQTGPLSGEAGAGALAEAFAGFAHMNGEADGPPLLPSLPLGDAMAGFSGVIGALLACYWRDRREGGSGRGQHVDVSMYEPILQLLGLPMATYTNDGDGPRRTGSRVAGGVPRNLYRARDGRWLALSGTTDAQVARVLKVIGRDGPDERARFGRSAERLQAADELDALVADWIAGRDREATLAAFRDAHVPVAPVQDLREIVSHPHVQARHSLERFADPHLGELTLVGPAPRLGETPGQLRHPGRPPEDDGTPALRDWLDLSADDLEALRLAGAL